MALNAAHKGYLYQDIVTAYFLARSLVEQYRSVTVDRKEYQGDLFDDLAIDTGQAVVRRQFKYGIDAPPLEVEDLTTRRRSLRIDDIVRCYTAAADNPADEYRICARWSLPTNSDLTELLEPLPVERSFCGVSTSTFRLKADIIWPANGEPHWKPLESVSRDAFVQFAARLVIELACPEMSGDLSSPGQIEQLLIRTLADDIGVGLYPNDHLDPRDVAAQLVVCANAARTDGRTLAPHDVEAAIRLRTDFGRVAQRFPIEERYEVRRENLLQDLADLIKHHPLLILTGEPGSGKSWVLTRLAEWLGCDNTLVARHYCYLEAGDPLVQERILSDSLFGNLLAELAEGEPALRGTVRPVYSAGPHELVQALAEAYKQAPNRRIVLIVDGLDHVSRVMREAPDIAPARTDIVTQLASLRLPDNVSLVVGSQPGEHLDPLMTEGKNVLMSAWGLPDVARLASRYGIYEQLKLLGLSRCARKITQAMAQRSEGNPLYATFLCRALRSAIESQDAIDPVDVVNTVPRGDLLTYYSYLLPPEDSVAWVIARLLSYIDFSLSTEELGHIFPALRQDIPGALKRLAPILKNVATQGGFRIYHESLRRFVVNRDRESGGAKRDILDSVTAWLEQRGFLEESRSYRFLLPCYRSSGRSTEMLERVNKHFVSESISSGHPRAAIDANLALAARIAAENLDWPALARIAELHRSVQTCFEEKLQDAELYGETYSAIHGATKLADRLLYDGRPTVSREVGLQLCSICEKGGVAAPWSEYLSLPKHERMMVNGPHPSHICAYEGLLRVRGAVEMISRTAKWLQETDDVDHNYLRATLRVFLNVAGTEGLLEILRQITRNERKAEIELVLAEHYIQSGQDQEAVRVAVAATEHAKSPEVAVAALELGASLDHVQELCPDLPTLTRVILQDKYPDSDAEIRTWLSGLRIEAAISVQHTADLREACKGIGWFRAWLRFAIDLAVASEAARIGNHETAEEKCVEAIRELSGFDKPFEGEPRACDLYRLHQIIHETFQLSLELLSSIDSWTEALSSLWAISSHTTTYLQGTPCGPLTREALSEILHPYVSASPVGQLVLNEIQKIASTAESRADFYEIQAEHEMRCASALSRAGLKEDAQCRWLRACQCLVGYGFRKDVTIWELLDSLPALSLGDTEQAKEAAVMCQALVTSVIHHTDGKATRHAPNAWFRALLEIDLTGASMVLARSLSRDGGEVDWCLEQAMSDVLGAVRLEGAPQVLASLAATQPSSGTASDCEGRLVVVRRLMDENRAAGEDALRQVAASIHGDSNTFDPAAWQMVQDFAHQRGIALAEAALDIGTLAEPAAQSEDYALAQSRSSWPSVREPFFASNATPLQMMARLRMMTRYLDNKKDTAGLVNALGYRLVQLAETGNADQAARLLRDFALHHFFSSSATLLANLGEGLAKYGQSELAACAYCLAYARSRGRGGWSSIGDDEQHQWFLLAVSLSQDVAWRELASVVANMLSKPDYLAGIASQIVQLLSLTQQHELAWASWRQAYSVIAYRLAWSADRPAYPFSLYSPTEVPNQSLDECLVALLVARISHPGGQSKLAALAGLCSIVETRPSLALSTLQSCLRVDTPETSGQLILQALLHSEKAPYELSTALASELKAIARCDSFGLRTLANRLLSRIATEE